jgi:hypothetical protein
MNLMQAVSLQWLIALLAICSFGGITQAAVLVRDGKPRAGILISEGAEKREELAARELRAHVEKISGAQLPMGGEAAQGMPTAIYVGSASPQPGLAKIREGGSNAAAFRLRVENDAVHLVGLSPAGTLNATYELLERLGVRWCMPGEVGTVLPKRDTIEIQKMDIVQHPGFVGRHLQAVAAPEWERRMRLGGLDSGGHSLGPRFSRKEEPELFMQEDGKPLNQVNVGKQEVIDRVVNYWRKRLERNPNIKYMRIGPRDGGGFGHHPWDSDDVDPLHGKVSVTDRYVKFFNIVLERLQKDYPEVGLGFYAYSQYMRPPVREEPNEKILPMLAPINLCRIHKVDSPHCWERQYMGKIIDGWQKTGVKMMYRGYFFNLCNPGIPYSMSKQVAAELPFFHEKGIIGCRVETMAAWAFHGPGLYLAAKMMWNPDADAEAVLDDYYAKLYGPAAAHVQRYFETLESAYLESDYHTGNVFDVPKILTDEVMGELDAALTEAEAKVDEESIEARRVQMVRDGLRAGELILATIRGSNHCNFEEARNNADAARKLLKAGMEKTPPRFDSSVGIGYFNRFWARTVDHGYKRTHEDGEKVLQLPDQWRFMVDPEKGGEELGLWKSELGNKSWRTIRTYTQSWSNQGLRYYKGDAWYRTRFEVPEEYRGRGLVLWLAGIDNKARVWVNGSECEKLATGASPIGRPWEFDLTDAVRFDGENIIAIRVRNDRLRELGTGGLTGPAMIYAVAE